MTAGTRRGADRVHEDRLAIERAREELLGTLEALGQPLARYSYLVGLGRALEPLPGHLRHPEALVAACQARAWLIEYPGPEAVRFRAWSESRIVAGLLALLLRIYDGRHPRAILEARPLLAAPDARAAGLARHLLPGREDGVREVHDRILAAARRSLEERPRRVSPSGGQPPSRPSAP